MVGKTLGELNIARTYGVLLLNITRMRISLNQTANLRIRKGDILKVSGPAEHIDLMGLDLGAV
ncbi:MAG: TrkA C-terminal domain-containing protein, partial [Deltaproteobacteria bacterium]|nr:TrkA C-terminal domain-containing protein [Candidatus Tharpella sp.]